MFDIPTKLFLVTQRNIHFVLFIMNFHQVTVNNKSKSQYIMKNINSETSN